MKKLKIVILILSLEILIFAVLADITYSSGFCSENNNWYWTVVNYSQNTVVNCPALASNPAPASIASKVELNLFEALMVIMPLTAITAIVIAIRTKTVKAK